MSGLARSWGVMLWMMPCFFTISFSARFKSTSLALAAIWPGIFSIRLDKPPICFICCIWDKKSFRSKPSPLLNLAAIFWAASISTLAVTCSTKATMSPMPSMRPACRSASKASRPSIFSLVPANLIGAPVICRTDKAAPPRESPSVLVSTMPVNGRASLNALAVLMASCPSMASTTNKVSTGFTAACKALISFIKASSMAKRPAVSTSSTST